MKTETKNVQIGKWIKRIVIIIIVLIVAIEVILQVLVARSAKKGALEPGNAAIYDVANVEPVESPLKGKTILFLGSSVTKGQAALGTSFVDYIEVRDRVNVIKEAKSATTLADDFSIIALMAYGNGESYVKRLEKINSDIQIECVVCQLSTNDATMKKPLGEISDSKDMKDLDKDTTTGAMEYIIAYAEETWGCPVVFYTGSYYESEYYAAMVDTLYDLQEKWGIGIIDMYTDETFNDIDEETYNLYMHDEIHPTKAGYLNWWTPKIEEYLEEYLQ